MVGTVGGNGWRGEGETGEVLRDVPICATLERERVSMARRRENSELRYDRGRRLTKPKIL